ncbi:hypothetical protein PQR53_18615 [Paraburkholderia fungorum]|uniref:hypothetical protein n=1 Tax=Paraburkholderia fungorum TaxID=134537 RepID=UPI0038BD7A81
MCEFVTVGAADGERARAYDMTPRLRTGGVVINGGLYSLMDAPFGGYKRSGLMSANSAQTGWMNRRRRSRCCSGLGFEPGGAQAQPAHKSIHLQ